MSRWVRLEPTIVIRRTAGIGATSSLPRAPAKVCLLNPKPALRLCCGNWSFCPTTDLRADRLACLFRGPPACPGASTATRGTRFGCGAFTSRALRRSFAGLVEGAMRTTLKVLAVTSAVLAAGASSPAMATYHCAAGYKYYNHACHPVRSSGHGNSASAPARSPGYGNPLSGAVSGMEAEGARGAASAGPVGAVVGGALGTASGAATGTSNMLLGH